MSVDLNGFLSLLPSVKDDYKWEIFTLSFAYSPYYLIRGNRKTCPLTAVAQKITNRTFSSYEYEKAGRAINLSTLTISEIQKACDTLMDWRADIRSSILQQLGMKESNYDHLQ